MIIGIGTDLCEIDRMKKLMQDERFLERYFAEEERVYIRDRGRVAPDSMAGIFAAKEALVKALGTGFLNTELKEICVLHDHLGKPYLDLRGNMAMHAAQMNITDTHLSITHEGNMAMAFVVAERNV